MSWDAGLRWAAGMLGLDTVELIAFSHVLLLDRDRSLLTDGSVDAVEIYAIALVATILLQVFGMLLVHWKQYRTGGAMQIIASAPHVIKLEGVIGVIGGLEAWRYPRLQAVAAVSRSDVPRQGSPT